LSILQTKLTRKQKISPCTFTLACVSYVFLTLKCYSLGLHLYVLMQYMLKKAFDLHKVACQTGAENELKAEFLSEERSQETIVTKHPNLEGESIEINPTSETEEHEQVPASHTGEKLEINDDGNFIQEEEKEMEKETERQLLKTATESMFS